MELLTPDIETSSGSSAGSKMDHADETVIDLKNVTSAPTPSNQSINNINVSNSTSVTDLLSPPDISLTTSISPGEETDATVTITPSSATNRQPLPRPDFNYTIFIFPARVHTS